MKLKILVLRIFRFGPKMVNVVKRLFEQSQLTLKLFKGIFDVDQNWTRLRSVTRDAQPQIPATGKLPLV